MDTCVAAWTEILGMDESVAQSILSVQVDSRNVSKGALFFALPGAKVDGHQFLKEVSQRGAIGAVVSVEYTGSDFGLSLWRVRDVLQTLQEVARVDLLHRGVKVIGITGSVGKTTTKEFTYALLENKYSVDKSPANYNSQIGLPLSILNAKREAKILVLEMAMTMSGQIERLVRLASPDIAVITKVDLVHSENFPDGKRGITQAKLEIFSHEKTQVRILRDDLKHETSLPKVTFSLTNPSADYYLMKIGDKYSIDERGVRAISFDLPFKEDHFIEDFLIAAVIARQCKMGWDEIEKEISKLKPPKMRFEKIQYRGTLLINDAYNAGPESMRAALASLPSPETGRKLIGVFGEMGQLGSFSKEVHKQLGHIALSKLDQVLCIGEECRVICELFDRAKKPAILYKNLTTLTKKLKEIMMPGDVILVKGSRHLSLEKIFEKLES